MKKMLKKAMAYMMTLAFVLLSPAAMSVAKADAVTDADPKDVYVSFGADLSASEKATVMQLMGITEADLVNYKVGTITNQDEKTYLGSYLDASVIGSRALSSVVVVVKEKGHGINVETKNITYCTPGMYTNALITAGISDADVIVAGPFGITGTAALVGAMRSYSELTGNTISEENMDTAINELVVTSGIAQDVNAEDVEALMAYVKEQVVGKDLTNDQEIGEVIDDACKELEITLTDEERTEIIKLMKRIAGLNLDVDTMKEQATDLFNKIEDMGLTKEQATGFFSKLWDSLTSFFKKFF